jgi:hypothetical protein
VFQALTGGVKRQLKEGRTEEQIEVWFVQAYLPPPETVVETKGAEKKCFVRLITASTRGQRHPSFVQLPPLVKVRHADRRKQGRKLFRLVRERGSPKGGEMQQTASKTEQAFKTCLVCKKSI